MNTEKIVFSKLFKEKKGVKLSLISDLENANNKAIEKREAYRDLENSWVDRYLDLQNEANVLNNANEIYLDAIIELRDVMETIKNQVSALGFDPRTITEFEDAMLTEGIFNANADERIEVLNVANTLKQL
jgi:hypothetical protein